MICSDGFELDFSEPSWAELGHFNFRAETELKILKSWLRTTIKFSKEAVKMHLCTGLATGLVTCFVTGLDTGLVTGLVTVKK